MRRAGDLEGLDERIITLGITALSLLKVLIDGVVCDLDVGLWLALVQ